MGDVALAFLDDIRKYLIYWSPSVVGVLVGGFLVQRYWVRKANESALIEYLTKELNDLVDETLEYWSLDCSGSKEGVGERRDQARMLEQQIKGAIKNLSTVLEAYGDRYCARFSFLGLRIGQTVDFAKLMCEVNDACTGGQFESAKRPPDGARFLSIINTTHRVRWKLLKRRV